MPNSIFMPICPKDIFDVKAAGEEARAEDLKKIPAEFFFERPAFETILRKNRFSRQSLSSATTDAPGSALMATQAFTMKNPLLFIMFA
jgi:hypothetical protein